MAARTCACRMVLLMPHMHARCAGTHPCLAPAGGPLQGALPQPARGSPASAAAASQALVLLNLAAKHEAGRTAGPSQHAAQWKRHLQRSMQQLGRPPASAGTPAAARGESSPSRPAIRALPCPPLRPPTFPTPSLPRPLQASNQDLGLLCHVLVALYFLVADNVPAQEHVAAQSDAIPLLLKLCGPQQPPHEAAAAATAGGPQPNPQLLIRGGPSPSVRRATGDQAVALFITPRVSSNLSNPRPTYEARGGETQEAAPRHSERYYAAQVRRGLISEGPLT